MSVALWLLAIQGLIGAFDTIYYHEWRARLPARVPTTTPELRLHAARDFLYAVLFASLPWIAWHGAWVLVLSAVILAEIILTMWDFITEAVVRKSFGDVYPGERVTHAVMGILYGAMTAYLIPAMIEWWGQPTGLVAQTAAVPEFLRWALTVMAAGVFASGVRDLYASMGLPNGGWPWGGEGAKQRGSETAKGRSATRPSG
jgi:hypothetical protein